MLMLDASSLAGVVAPLPLWPRKPTPLDQLSPLKLACPSFPRMMWSCTEIPGGFATSSMTLVISISAREGVGSPEGRLCTSLLLISISLNKNGFLNQLVFGGGWAWGR
jgi:hypothetical protein